MKRAVIMIPHPRTEDDAGGCLFEVFSPNGCTRSALTHDVCPDVPPGELWGSEHLLEPWDPSRVEATIRAAFPGSVVREWRERLVIGDCPELAAVRQRVAEARVALQAAINQLEQAEADLHQFEPQVVDLP